MLIYNLINLNKNNCYIFMLYNNYKIKQEKVSAARMAQHIKYTPVLNQKQNMINPIKYERNDNKKVITSLKEEMTNIRQGMSKLLKIKSQENLKIVQNNYMVNKQLPGSSKILTSSKNGSLALEAKQVQQMQDKIKDLEEENFKLQSKVKQLQSGKALEISKHLKKQSQLQDQNTILFVKVKNLIEELQKIKDSQKRLRRSNSKKSVVKTLEMQKQNIVQTLNPETQTYLANQQMGCQWPHYEQFIKQNEFLRKTLTKLEQKNMKLEYLYIQNLKLIDGLNEKLILAEFNAKESKYLKQLKEDHNTYI